MRWVTKLLLMEARAVPHSHSQQLVLRHEYRDFLLAVHTVGAAAAALLPLFVGISTCWKLPHRSRPPWRQA